MSFFHMAKKKAATSAATDPSPVSYTLRYLATLALLILASVAILLPYSFWWLYTSGDSGMERAVQRQAKGDFVIFGSGTSQDFVDYKLELYAAIKPQTVTIGSSRVMQFRGAWFKGSFLNMGGMAGNLAVLGSSLEEMLKIHKPKVVIIGLDFWWFLPQWDNEPEKRVPRHTGSYNYGLANLKKPWEWLLEGKLSFAGLAAPILGIFGKGFRADRYGIMAQQTNDGFGPDGSWYYSAEITGRKPPFDFQFQDTLKQVEHGIKAFYHAKGEQSGPAESHIDAFAAIWCKLRSRGIATYVFIPPLAPKVYQSVREKEKAYPHLFKLRSGLMARGIEVMDFGNPLSLSSTDCEFIDGFHGGELAYARILRRMADHWPALLAYVNVDKLDAVIRDWGGHTLVPDVRLTADPEVDFMRMGCPKKDG